MQDHNAGPSSSVQEFWQAAWRSQSNLGLTWAAANTQPDTTLIVWKPDKDFKKMLSVQAASVGCRSEDLKAD